MELDNLRDLANFAKEPKEYIMTVNVHSCNTYYPETGHHRLRLSKGHYKTHHQHNNQELEAVGLNHVTDLTGTVSAQVRKLVYTIQEFSANEIAWIIKMHKDFTGDLIH